MSPIDPATPRNLSAMARYKWAILCFILFLVMVPLQIIVMVGMSSGNPGHSLVTPGSATFTIAHGGEYTLWFQNQLMDNGQMLTAPLSAPAGLTITLQAADGSVIPLQVSSFSKSISVGSWQAEAYAAATIPAPGSYTLTAAGSSERRLLYFSQDVAMKLILTGGGFACVTAILFFMAMGLALHAFFKKPMPTAHSADVFPPAELH